AIATINGQPMDQILYAGKSFMANCKGSRSGASPRTRSAHCLDLSVLVTQIETDGDADMDVDPIPDSETTALQPTPVELARASASPEAYKGLSSTSSWITHAANSRMSKRLRSFPSTQIRWTNGNKFAVLEDLELDVEGYSWASSDESPPNRVHYQGKFTKAPPATEAKKEFSTLVYRTPTDQAHLVAVAKATPTFGSFADNARKHAPLESSAVMEVSKTQLLDVRDLDIQFRSDPNYDMIEKTIKEKPIAASSTMLSYIRMRDTALDELVDMHLFARCLATPRLLLGSNYQENFLATFPAEKSLRRDPATSWFQDVLNGDSPLRAKVELNRAIALFELLLRSMAPKIADNDCFLLALSGVQIHWIPTFNDRFLHPATLLALAATGVGNDIIATGLRSDGDQYELNLLQSYLEDEDKLAAALEDDLALVLTLANEQRGVEAVSGLILN
ncbi:hypothetical protein Gpo141_00013570, partial [Globisporangium polare]